MPLNWLPRASSTVGHSGQMNHGGVTQRIEGLANSQLKSGRNATVADAQKTRSADTGLCRPFLAATSAHSSRQRLGENRAFGSFIANRFGSNNLLEMRRFRGWRISTDTQPRVVCGVGPLCLHLVVVLYSSRIGLKIKIRITASTATLDVRSPAPLAKNPMQESFLTAVV